MDPIAWTVDQVVANLCEVSSQEVHKQLHIRSCLDLENLEASLRANDIDGGTLLDLEDVNVKDDLGIQSFGQRRELRRIIHHLRSKSSTYQSMTKTPQITQTSGSESHKRVYSESEYEDFGKETAPIKRTKRIQPINITSSVASQPQAIDDELEGPWLDLLHRHQTRSDEEVLRPYGESDSEIELDSDDSLAAELESVITASETGIHTTANVDTRLSAEAIDVAIEEALQDFRDDWNTHSKPKKHKHAVRRWYQAARAGTRRPQQNALRRELAQYYTRLAKFRSHVADMVRVEYTDRGEVKKNCLNLQTTVEEIAEREYYLDVLESEYPPEELVRAENSQRVTVRPTLLEDEESLHSSSSESESSVSSSEDSLEDAIATDDNVEAAMLPDDLLDDEWHPHLPSPLPNRAFHMKVVTRNTSADFRAASPLTFLDNQVDLQMASGTSSDSPQTAPHYQDQASPQLEPDLAQTVPPVSTSLPVLKLRLKQSSVSDDTKVVDADTTNEIMDLTLPASRYKHLGGSQYDAITLSDSSPISEHIPSDYGIRTPPLLGETPTKSSRNNMAKRKFPDIVATRRMKWTEAENSEDSRLCLAKAIYRRDRAFAQAILEYLATMRLNELSSSLRAIILEISDAEESPLEQGDCSQQAPIYWAFFFVIYYTKTGFKDPWSIDEVYLDQAYEATNAYASSFDRELKGLLKHYITTPTRSGDGIPLSQESALASSPEISQKWMSNGQTSVPGSAFRQSPGGFASGTESDLELELRDIEQTAFKRRRPVQQNQESIAKQKEDQLRVEEQEARRRLMKSRLESKGVSNKSRQVLVNSEEPPVYLDPHIAQFVKEHQVTGIQFIWRELVEDTKGQGCLLAHTMGLGKTMQVISFLVTLAQCNKSENPAIQNKISKPLRSGYTLVICPASLVDNWFDEILMWTPHTTPDLLGPRYKLEGSRLRKVAAIYAWSKSAGVLLTSYETLRSILSGKGFEIEEREQLKEALLELPAVVVADEAHKLKNARSAINEITKQFKTTSRIALTGSPLNNHLEEYHTMIDWIAPNYLGTISMFRDKYSEPIERGLSEDSSRFDKRLSVKKLWVLKRDLAPKIDRKDISAIADDMPQKTEFFITVPLTEVQHEIYSLLVDHILSTVKSRATGNSSMKLANTQLWTWLSMLSWLDNHPACLISKLQDKHEKSYQNAVRAADNEDLSDEANELPQDLDLHESSIEALLPKMLDIIKTHNNYAHSTSKIEQKLTHPALSTRALISQQLIEESIGAGEKILLFSHSIPTLDYLQSMLARMGCSYQRIDGSTAVNQRQAATKSFNEDQSDCMVFLISTRAGGLGLNLQGANRVIIYDFGFNPSWEEQAIGRAYRLGQKKPVFVYRFCAGGTFEEAVHNKSVFKTQLFSRVVDSKNVVRQGTRKIEDYVFPPRKAVHNEDMKHALGRDEILDRIVDRLPGSIRSLVLTETFQREDKDDALTADELAQVQREYELERLARLDPVEYQRKLAEERQRQVREQQQVSTTSVLEPPPAPSFSQIFNPLHYLYQATEELGTGKSPSRTQDTSDTRDTDKERKPGDMVL